MIHIVGKVTGFTQDSFTLLIIFRIISVPDSRKDSCLILGLSVFTIAIGCHICNSHNNNQYCNEYSESSGHREKTNLINLLGVFLKEL